MHIQPLFLRIQTYPNFLMKLLLKVFLLRIISTKPYQHLLKIGSLSTDSHTHNTRWFNLGCLKIPPHKTKIHGRQSVNISAIYTWNYLQSHHGNITFHQLSLTRLKKLIMQYYFSNYDYQPFLFLSCMYIFVFCFFYLFIFYY